MNDNRKLDKVREIISDVTHYPLGRIDEQSTYETVEGWDSVAQINVIVALESEFDVSFTAEEVFELNTVRKLLDALETYSAGR